MRKIFLNKTLVFTTILILIVSMLPILSFNTTADPIHGEKPPIEEEGWSIKGSGTYFEITNSPYLNVILESSVSIDIYMESIPRIIDLTIYKNNVAISTEITLSGLDENNEYYHFEDDILLSTFTTDQGGSYNFIQDLTTLHHVMIKEEPSTVYIHSDGSIDPISSPITVIGDTYKLTSDIYDELVIQKSGIILDGQGYTVQGTGINYGIYIEDGINIVSDVTIKNLNVNGFYDGIRAYRCTNINIIDNNVDENIIGIRLLESDNCIIEDNTVSFLGYGVDIRFGGGGHIVKGNTLLGYDYTVTIPQGTFYTIGIYNWYPGLMNTIDNNDIRHGYYGILMRYDENGIISHNEFSECIDNIWITDCYGTLITGNIINGLNGNYGIGTGWSDSVTIANNLIIGFIWYGFDFFYSTNHLITGNILNGLWSYYGIYLNGCSHFTIANNLIQDWWYGFELGRTNDCDIYHNTIIVNYIPVFNEMSLNNWDNGAGEGNYWSDYFGLDDGSNSRVAGDGVGDTDIPHPYVGIPSVGYYQLDNFPLMNPMSPINVVIDIKPGSDPNTINTKSKGQVPVAILTTDTFCASVVDPETVIFLGSSAVQWAMQDVDYDGDIDMILHFITQDLNFELVETISDSEKYAELTAETIFGYPLVGKDSVRLIGAEIFQEIIYEILEKIINRFPILQRLIQ